MATFAKISLGGIVINIELVDDSIATTEQAGIDFLTKLYNIQGSDPYFKQSFRDGRRKNSATMGGTYDPVKDAFIDHQHYPSHTLNETTCHWDPPVPRPDDGEIYRWDEPSKSWKQ